MSGGAPWRVKPTTRMPFSRAWRARLPPMRPNPITAYSFLVSVIDLLLIPCSFFIPATLPATLPISPRIQSATPSFQPLDCPQDRSSRSAVATLDLDRQTDQLVLAGFH